MIFRSKNTLKFLELQHLTMEQLQLLGKMNGAFYLSSRKQVDITEGENINNFQ